MSRANQLSETSDGQKLLTMMIAVGLSFEDLIERYKAQYKKHRQLFASRFLAVGHGDPCLSNILYDQQHMILKLIDPRGAREESELWTHPLYDYCKLSHSINGDYDFINHGLFNVTLNATNEFKLSVKAPRELHELKRVFEEYLLAHGEDLRAIKIGECSLFLSMIPLHIDHPNKALAFVLNAQKLLKEIELYG
ncbi:MAG: hypothetical protein EOP06_04965 [Proteobacteria bacterium]|nr:MAG: hypothetical protein EOP06_04965 [Pseudomonadota bacterium]